MGKAIPKPIPVTNYSLMIGALRGEKVIVDESQGILEDILKVSIVAASIDGEALMLPLQDSAIGSLGFLNSCARGEKSAGLRERKSNAREKTKRAHI